MIRASFISALLIVSLLLPAIGLSCSSAKITAISGQEFTLPVGQTVVISGTGLMLKFVAVDADSRCAKGNECIVAGEAKCRIGITYKGASSDIVITQPGIDASSHGTLGNFKVDFKLEPYPEAGKPIAKSDYKLVMTVTK